MKTLLFTLALSLYSPAPLHADIGRASKEEPEVPPPPVSDADYAELKKLVLPYMYSFTKSSTVYNWHRASEEEKGLYESSKDPKGFEGIQKMTNRYWEKQTSFDTMGAMYGTGLYTALDPVVTRSYGGENEKEWVLSQIRLPQGFKMLDVSRDGNVPLPLHKRNLIARLGCPPAWKNQGFLNNLVNPTTYQGYPKCAAVARRLFKDDLKIDGFAYSYQATSFKDCEKEPVAFGMFGSSGSKQAFVITDGRKIKPEDVRVYNRNTKDDEESRLRIQSMMVKGAFDSGFVPGMGGHSVAKALDVQISDYLNEEGLTQYLPWAKNIANHTQAFNAVGASMKLFNVAMICDKPVSVGAGIGYPGTATTFPTPGITAPAQCVQLTFLSAHQPGGMGGEARKAPTEISAKDLSPQHFLWKDLEGRKLDSTLPAWMRRNIYGCSISDKYKQAHKRQGDEFEDTEVDHVGEDDSQDAESAR